ncbi:SGNH/GDSL hydrolase family protein [Pseudarthrobacter sp. YS3]|uniref:SGNH/GDSL hydrolase family protein n=1 Tax=Pseudarthrobacter sp. YS3 TaxID=3453718 RepID=UPI003EEAE640
MTLLLLTGGGVSAPAAPALTTLRQFTDRTATAYGVSPQFSAGTSSYTHKSVHVAKAAAKNIQLVYGNNYSTSYTVAAAIEWQGSLYPLTFGGASQKTLSNGQFAISDALPITVAAGDSMPVRTFVTGAVGAYVPWVSNDNLQTARGEGEVTNADLTLAGSGTIAANGSAFGRGPTGIHGLSPASTVSVLVCGDSITEGGNDTTGGMPKGFATRGLRAAGVPYTNAGKWAEQAGGLYSGGTTTALFNARFHPQMLAAATHVLCEQGRNDVANVNTVASLMAIYLGLWGALGSGGAKVYQTTITPGSDSTDGWTTLVGQTARTAQTQEAKRVSLNDWFRDGAPTVAGVGVTAGSTDPTAKRAGAAGHPLTGYIEVADTVESSRNSGKWAVDAGALTADGTHPETIGHNRMLTPVQTWAAGLTA